MAYILQSTDDETLYFTGTVVDKINMPIFDVIARARQFTTRSEASQLKDFVTVPTQIVEV